MKNIQSLVLPVLCIICLTIGCRKGEDTIMNLQEEAVNEILSGGELINRPEEQYEEHSKNYNEEKTDTKDFLCNGKRIKKTVVLDNLTLNAFDDRSATNTAALYPGSIIKIKDYMEQRDLNGISNYRRNPIEVSSDLGDIREVVNPSNRGNVDKAIKEIEQANPDFAAKVISESIEAYSLSQAMVDIGIDVKSLGNSVKGRFGFSSTVEEHSFAVKFYQIYHTASVSNPVSPAELFDPSVSIGDVQNLVDQAGPLGYVTEVAYGRMLIGIFTYRGTEFKTSSEVQGKFRKGISKVNADIDVETKNFFKNSTFKVAILGGDSQEASKVAGSGLGMESIQAAYQWMVDGGKDPSLGVPIQYKIRQLADPSYPLLAIGGTVEYEVLDCDALPNQVQITAIDITSIPAVDPDNKNKPWDAAAIGGAQRPDVFLAMSKYENSEWRIVGEFRDKKCQDCATSDLPHSIDGLAYTITEEDFRSSFALEFIDEDIFDQYHHMGFLNFSFRKFIRSVSNPEPSNPFPTVATFNDGAFTVKIHLTWETK